MSSRVIALVAGIALAATVSGCGADTGDSSGTEPGNPLTIEVSDMTYTPSSLTIAVGETVTWVFDDRGVPHDVVGTGDAESVLRSPLLKTGTWEHTFTEPGTYDYTCSLHPDMIGVVVVV